MLLADRPREDRAAAARGLRLRQHQQALCGAGRCASAAKRQAATAPMLHR